MQLTVRDVARCLKVPERTVHAWVKDEGLPAAQVKGQYRFNPAELLEWAALRRLSVDPALFAGATGTLDTRLDAALEAGGVLANIRGVDRDAILRAVVEAMPVPECCDRAFLLEVLVARENAGSTSIGNGIAVPHPRYPIVMPGEQPSLTLCYLETPILYGGGDGAPVHTLFVMLCPTVRHHLQLLARLSAALQDAPFAAAVGQKAPAAAIIAEARRLEEAYVAANGTHA
ncbi:hypothetical protein AYO44_03995 [Planctomycetaceae bacterium SCGC AG-212-F19]|nr:hypothetical protein AYO44_03995 [Planctomycetaceae bacterium SCGC AG-212-F19]